MGNYIYFSLRYGACPVMKPILLHNSSQKRTSSYSLEFYLNLVSKLRFTYLPVQVSTLITQRVSF